VLVGYVVVHIAIAALFSLFAADQARRGEFAPSRLGSLPNWRLWQFYTLVAACTAMAGVFAQEMGE